MKRKNHFVYLLIIIAAIIIIAAFYFFYGFPGNLPTSFVVNNRSYQITSYAYTIQQQEKGLMNATVSNNTFMLFAFNSDGIYPFWMKNTYNSLDIMWIEYNNASDTGKIVYFVNATPCISYDPEQINCIVYTPNSSSNYVIEAKSGFVERNNIVDGTAIKFLYR